MQWNNARAGDNANENLRAHHFLCFGSCDCGKYLYHKYNHVACHKFYRNFSWGKHVQMAWNFRCRDKRLFPFLHPFHFCCVRQSFSVAWWLFLMTSSYFGRITSQFRGLNATLALTHTITITFTLSHKNSGYWMGFEKCITKSKQT